MTFLTNMKIGKRLGVAFGTILLLMVLLIAVGLYNLWLMSSQLEHITGVNIKKIMHASGAADAVNGIYLAMTNAIIAKDPASQKQEVAKIEKARERYKKEYEELDKLETFDEGKKLIAKSREVTAANRDINNRAIDLVVSGQQADAYAFYTSKVKPVSHSIQDSVNEIVKYNEDRIKTRTADAMKSAGTARIVFIVLGVVQMIVAVLLGLIITKSIKGPVTQGVGFAERMADGDLTQRLDIVQKDEVGDLAAALNAMSNHLNAMFKEIAQGVHTLTASSTELSAISKQMSEGAEQTSNKANLVSVASEEMNSNMTSVAAAMEEASTNINVVASATEEMTATISEIAKNTEKARNITTTAVGQSAEINRKINDLGSAASEIGKITETITTISAQTNLLALNATIEAARAGAAGKGFAVVANEIKELAQQTATATDDIKNKIEGIQTSTSGTIGDIGSISKTIQEVNEIVTAIAAAIEEQTVVTKDIAGNVAQAAQGIEEVNRNVAQSSNVSANIAQDISEVNQAAGEMSSSSAQVQISAEELSKVSEQIQALVAKFKV
jgi:methyl-accepting chemotaxis protein